MKRIIFALTLLSSTASFADDWSWSTGGTTAPTPSQPSTPVPDMSGTSGSPEFSAKLNPGVGMSQDKAGAITSFEGNGAVVRFIAVGSPLAASGLELGDKILQINFQPVTSAGRYAQLIVQAVGPTPLTVQDVRTGQVRTVYVNLF